jgi:DNA-binding NtrC family response regulator
MSIDRVLLLDDEAAVRFPVRDFLESNGFEVQETETCAQAHEAFRSWRPDVAVLDYSLNDGNALDLLPKLRALDSTVPVVILTAHGSIDLAVRAIKEGADQFLTKPVELPTLLVVVKRLLEIHRIRQKQLAGKSRQDREAIDPFLGSSAAIRRFEEEARKIAASESPVLIQGETGTGKGVIARWLHANGPRAEHPFVDLNCAGLSKDFLETELFGHDRGAFTGAVAVKQGLLEIAHRGTIFLDEIGDLDLDVQPKLLKVLEEKEFRRLGDVRDRKVDIRLIGATHQDLPALVRENRFRNDLYFRISTIPLRVPALRERPEDIIALARLLMNRSAAEIGKAEPALASGAEKTLTGYDWPGNIRELRNVLERAILLSPSVEIRANDLQFGAPASAGWTPGTGLTLEEVEVGYITRVLEEESGHVERAAKRLGIPRSSLYQKIRNHRIPVSKI